jgi:hypothetical protein
MSYIAWICPLLRPQYLENNEYLYFEGDEVLSITFMKLGNCSFVLPKYENMRYVDIGAGDNFGIEDIVGSMIKYDEIDMEEWMQHRDKIVRQFTVMSSPSAHSEKTIILHLSINDVNRMQVEFNEIYQSLFDQGYARLNDAL